MCTPHRPPVTANRPLKAELPNSEKIFPNQCGGLLILPYWSGKWQFYSPSSPSCRETSQTKRINLLYLFVKGICLFAVALTLLEFRTQHYSLTISSFQIFCFCWKLIITSSDRKNTAIRTHTKKDHRLTNRINKICVGIENYVSLEYDYRDTLHYCHWIGYSHLVYLKDGKNV